VQGQPQTRPPLSAYVRLTRLDRPTGVFLLALPCLWGVALQAPSLNRALAYSLLFAFGALIMRSAGCVTNDIWDRKIDARVARTKGRPLASGELSLRQALALLAALLCLGLAVLPFLNPLAVLLSFAAAGMAGIYPLSKRFLPVPQAFLGLTFNAGVPIASAAVSGAVPLSAWLLYAAGVFWTVAYDTVYANQDKKDDAEIGIRSAALLFGRRNKEAVGLCYLAMLALLAAAARHAGMPLSYALAGAALPAIPLFIKLRNLDVDSPPACAAFFAADVKLGVYVWLFLAAGRLIFLPWPHNGIDFP
jgi:4-hydroxybenzoate polyprenyltransferase